MDLLTSVEVRVLGALIEKAYTTPDYYPMTLNALVNACNQKSNREPIVEYTSSQVNDGVAGLKAHGMVAIVMGSDSRVPKYRHYFEESFGVSEAETAVLDVLMLRGPQTTGELRTRAERLFPFAEPGDVEVVLEGLATRVEGPLVVKLPRQPGQKEARFAHLLSGEPEVQDEPTLAETHTRSERLQRLEDEVAQVRQELTELREAFAEFRKQFEP